MPTRRSYSDACPIARALDVVGERWALLLIRELLFGPQRFADLRRALPAMSPAMVTARLRELESHGVVARATLPPPGRAHVYELTDRGRALDPVLTALGEWGGALAPPAGSALSPGAVLLYLRTRVRTARPRPEGAYLIELGEQPWTVTVDTGGAEISPGVPGATDATISTDPETLNALLAGEDSLAVAIAGGRARAGGDGEALARLLSAA